MGYVKIGAVAAFDKLESRKAQALKPLEAAAEAFTAWQIWHNGGKPKLGAERQRLLYALCNVIVACSNLAKVAGCSDLTTYLATVEENNRKRGWL